MMLIKILKKTAFLLIFLYGSANILICGNDYFYNIDSTKCVTFLKPFPLTYPNSEYFHQLTQTRKNI